MKTRYVILAFLIWLAGATFAQAFYNPNSGRWPSRDPIAEAGGANICAYVWNSPLLMTDFLGLTPASELESVLRREIYRLEADPSFLVYTTHYPPFLRRLERLLPNVKVTSNPSESPTYDYGTDTLNLIRVPPGIDASVHELTHAYNDQVLGFSAYWQDREDEGIAWTIEKFGQISDQLIELGQLAMGGGCNRREINKQWRKFWKYWGRFDGSWNVYTWQTPMGGTELIGRKQINDTSAATGVRVSCVTIAEKVNALLSDSTCCFRVRCKASEKISKWDIEPELPIDPVFE